MDEIAIARNIAEGQRAELLIKEEAYQRWVRQIEKDLFNAWLDSNPRDVEGRERIYAQIHAGRKFQEFVRIVAANGRLAQRDLEIRKRRPRVA